MLCCWTLATAAHSAPLIQLCLALHQAERVAVQKWHPIHGSLLLSSALKEANIDELVSDDASLLWLDPPN
jgi:hypothetical protein